MITTTTPKSNTQLASKRFQVFYRTASPLTKKSNYSTSNNKETIEMSNSTSINCMSNLDSSTNIGNDNCVRSLNTHDEFLSKQIYTIINNNMTIDQANKL